jgi:hypothetical protein
MTNLGHVYIIKKDREEITNLEKKSKDALLVNIFRFILLLAFQIIIFNNMNFLLHQPFLLYYFHQLSPNGNKTGSVKCF